MLNKSGLIKISVENNLQELFDLDVKVAKSSPYILPLETPIELLNFLIKDHKSDTYIYYDEGNQ